MYRHQHGIADWNGTRATMYGAELSTVRRGWPLVLNYPIALKCPPKGAPEYDERLYRIHAVQSAVVLEKPPVLLNGPSIPRNLNGSQSRRRAQVIANGKNSLAVRKPLATVVDHKEMLIPEQKMAWISHPSVHTHRGLSRRLKTDG
jgi:hypothetical protein